MLASAELSVLLDNVCPRREDQGNLPGPSQRKRFGSWEVIHESSGLAPTGGSNADAQDAVRRTAGSPTWCRARQHALYVCRWPR